MKVKQKVLKAYKDVFTESGNYRYVILMGGRGAGRSTVVSQFILSKMLSPDYFRGAIMRFIYGDIKNSIHREVSDRIEEQGIEKNIKVDNLNFNYGANSVNAIGFRKSSGEQKSKLKSLANYNYVFIEEADEINEEDFMQLDDSIRTLKGDITIFLILNPPDAEHWIIKKWFDLEPTESPQYFLPKLKQEYQGKVLYIKSDYTDNIRNLSQDTIDNYERYQITNQSYYWNTIKGYVPKNIEGKIFNSWRMIDEIPFEAQLLYRGLDFGYTQDPTALIEVYEYNGGYILNELLYETALPDTVIADKIKSQKEQCLVLADRADKTMISNLKRLGVNIEPAEKWSGSVKEGVFWLQNQKISYTRSSVNIEKEYRKYLFTKSKSTGEFTNEPIDNWNHLMDALRYALSYKIQGVKSASLNIPKIYDTIKRRQSSNKKTQW